jgi:hypothetical protein
MPAVYFSTQLLPFSCVSVFQLCILKLYQGVKFSAELASVIGGMPVVVTALLQIVLETMAFTSFGCLPAPSVLIVSRNVMALTCETLCHLAHLHLSLEINAQLFPNI